MAKKKLREDYRDGELYHGEDVNAITKRVNELDDTSVDITNVLEGKQDKLTAGANITIDENNVISAKPQDLSQYALSADVATELAKKADASALTEYQEATNAAISANTRDIEILDNGKQDKLTAGKNIQIDVYNTISAKGYEYKEENDQFEIGKHTLTSNPNEVAMGRYNYTRTEGGSGNTLVSIGNGTEDPASGRSNAFEVLDNGKVYIDGVGGYDGRYIENHKSVSEVISDLENGKQDVLTAGENITIENNVISAQQPDLTPYATTEAMNEALSGKQDTLIAGSGITIENNVISAEQPSLEGYALSADVETELAKKQDTLTAGTNITIQNGVISAQQPDLSPYALTSEVESAISQVEESKQDKLSAGTNITIQDNVISATVPDVSGKMNKVDYEVAYTLPSGAIDLSPLDNVLTPGIYNLKVNSFIPNTSYNGVLMVGRQGNSFSQEVVISGSQTQVLKRATSNSGSTWTTMYAGCLAHVNDNSDGNGYGGINETYSANKILTLIDEKQNQLTAGTNITIVDDVISAQQPDLSPYALSADVTTELAKKVDTTAYTQDKAAIQASISANTTAITQLQQSKQNNLSAGTGIQIQNDVISLTGSGGAMIDDTTTGSTTAWSSQKIVNEMGIGLIDLTNSGNAIRF